MKIFYHPSIRPNRQTTLLAITWLDALRFFNFYISSSSLFFRCIFPLLLLLLSLVDGGAVLYCCPGADATTLIICSVVELDNIAKQSRQAFSGSDNVRSDAKITAALLLWVGQSMDYLLR